MFSELNPLPVDFNETKCSGRMQVCTQRSWKRPYGVGLLVAGLDEAGPHLYYNCPSGNYAEYHAFAIGSRSQAAKTYLERKFETFMECTKEELIRHALFAVKESLQEEELSSGNCGVAIVGIDEPFVVLDPKTLQAYIEALDSGKDEMQTVEETGTDDRQSSQVPQEGTGSRGISVGASEDTPTDMET